MESYGVIIKTLWYGQMPLDARSFPKQDLYYSSRGWHERFSPLDTFMHSTGLNLTRQCNVATVTGILIQMCFWQYRKNLRAITETII